MEGVKESLKSAPGPMPWYCNELPEITGHMWKRHDSGEIHLIAESSQECKLIICMYTRVIVLAPSYIVGWYENDDHMHIDVLDIRDISSRESVKSGEKTAIKNILMFIVMIPSKPFRSKKVCRKVFIRWQFRKHCQ